MQKKSLTHLDLSDDQSPIRVYFSSSFRILNEFRDMDGVFRFITIWTCLTGLIAES